MKALACFAIVVLHSFNYAYIGYAATDAQRITAAVIRNLMLWAVPCFVMATGTLMLDSERNVTYKKLFGKLIPKMLIPLVVFTFAFACFDGVATNTFDFKTVLKTTWSNIITGSGWSHMWYLYLMVAIYLMLPIYRIITRTASKQELIYLAVVYYASLSLLKTTEQLTSQQTAFYICVYTVYPLYLFLGYMIHNKHIELKPAVYAVMAVVSATAYTAVTVYGELHDKNVADIVTKYTFPALPFMAIGIYGLFYAFDSKESILDKAFREIEKCSFGIYLIHMAGLKYIYAVKRFNPYEHGGEIAVLGVTVAVFVVSFAVMWFILFVASFIKKQSTSIK